MVNELRIAVTVLAFLSFLGIVFWAWSSKRRAQFEEAAMLPFTEENVGRSSIHVGRVSTRQVGLKSDLQPADGENHE